MKKNKRLIAKIFDGENEIITVDENLLYAEFGALDRGNITDTVEYGIYANRASLSFIDNSGFFDTEKTNRVSRKGYTIKFYLSYKEQEVLAGTFKYNSEKYNRDTRQVEIDCVSKLEDWQNIKQQEICPYYTNSAKTLMELVASDTKIESEYELGKTWIDCPYFPAETKWSRVTKICQATTSRVFDDTDGTPVISSPRHHLPRSISILPSNILEITENSFVDPQKFSIDITNRSTKPGFDPDGNVILGNIIDELNPSFTINYDGYIPVSVDGGNYEFNTSGNRTYVTISKRIKSPSKMQYNGVKREIKSYITITSEVIDIVNEKTTISIRNEKRDAVAYCISPSEIELSLELEIVADLRDVFIFFVEKVTNISVRFGSDHFVDGEKTTIKSQSYENEPILAIPSNDLIHTRSYYTKIHDDGLTPITEIPLGEHILEEAKEMYGNGLEAYELDCLFNDYYHHSGVAPSTTKVIDGSDMSNTLKRYDIVVPYVNKKGEILPFSKYSDGKPKEFFIIGISYLYDGLLRQRLQLQEVPKMTNTQMGLE